MLARDAFGGHQLGVDGVSRDPGELLICEDEREAVAVLARDARVDEDVLQLARATASGRPKAQAGAAIAEAELDTGAEVDGVTLLTARAASHLEPRRGLRSRLRPADLHAAPHDTETQAAGKIQASPASAWPGQLQHRFEVSPRKAGLAAARVGVHPLQGFNLGGRVLGDLLKARGGERGAVEAARDAGTVALERGQDL